MAAQTQKEIFLRLLVDSVSQVDSVLHHFRGCFLYYAGQQWTEIRAIAKELEKAGLSNPESCAINSASSFNKSGESRKREATIEKKSFLSLLSEWLSWIAVGIGRPPKASP